MHEVVRASVRGEYGVRGPHVWISPLLSLFWFFDLTVVARTHRFLGELDRTTTIWDVTLLLEALRHEIEVRPKSSIPF